MSLGNLDKKNTQDIPQILVSPPSRQNNDCLFNIRNEC